MKKHVLLVASAAAGLGGALPALAQNADGSGAYVDSGDIVVTARKREESIMKVPVVTTTVDQEQLQRFESGDIRRIADQVPGLIVGESVAAFGSQMSLRGVGTSTLNATVDQSIALNIDGQQFTQGLAYAAGMFDIQQVTVLKGPQALFFGKASPGGVIAIQTANPTSDLEVTARAGYEFEAETKQGDLIVSGPLSSTLGFRIAGRFNQSNGYFRNIGRAIPGTGALDPEPAGQHTREWTTRGTLLWEPIDRFSARLKVTYNDRKVSGRASQLGSCPDGTTPPPPGIDFIGRQEDCRIDRNFTNVDLDPAAFPGIHRGGRQYNDVEQVFGVLELNYDATDTLKVTSVSGYYHVDEHDQFNASSSGGAGPTFSSATDFRREDFTEELRLASNFEGPLNFTLGAYYENVDMFKHGYAIGNAALIARGFRIPANVSDGTHDVKVESESAFGQLLWKITPTLELAGGARWTHEKRTHEYVNLLVRSTPIRLKVPKLESDKVSPEVTLTYTPTDDFTVFAAFKQGYKSGSFNSSGSFLDGADTSFGDEKVVGGEVGIKARVADRSLRLDLSGYYYKYSGLQVGASEINPVDGTVVPRTLNAASAKIYGIEADVHYTPPSIEGLTLNAAANWNHARYDRFDNAPCWGGQLISDGCDLILNPATGRFTSQDLSGRELLRSPDFMASGGFDYQMPVGGGMKVTLAGSARYSSSYYSDILLRRDELQSAFVKLNASIALAREDDGWELALIGNNLTDKLLQNKCTDSNSANSTLFGGVNTGATTAGSAGVNELSCTIDPGREVWLRATVKF